MDRLITSIEKLEPTPWDIHYQLVVARDNEDIFAYKISFQHEDKKGSMLVNISDELESDTDMDLKYYFELMAQSFVNEQS